jgi:hypothetical protein
MEYLIRFVAGLALWKEGSDYVSIEGRSMILGALALAAYSLVVCQLLVRLRWSALAATTTAILLWLAIALESKQPVVGRQWLFVSNDRLAGKAAGMNMSCASCSVDWQQLWPELSPSFSNRKQAASLAWPFVSVTLWRLRRGACRRISSA